MTEDYYQRHQQTLEKCRRQQKPSALPQVSPVRASATAAARTPLSPPSLLPQEQQEQPENHHHHHRSTSTPTSRLPKQPHQRLDTPALTYLSQRPFGGKCYESSPKFVENKKTWNNVGYGVQGIIPETDLYHPEPDRRSPLSIAPMFPKQKEGRRESINLNIANNFRRKQKGLLALTRGGSNSSNSIGGNTSAWEDSHNFMPLQTKQNLKEKSEVLVERSVRKRSTKIESQEQNRVMGKCLQQLTYYQGQMESQGYLNRQRGIGTGKSGLASLFTQHNRGGYQVAGCVRGRDTPWLGR